ncbi:hypothetical protein ACFL6S_08515 [Candidatus Poribacteria bacterium]
MGSVEDVVSKVSQEISSDLSQYKIDVNFKLQDLQDEELRQKMTELFEIHERFLESVMGKVLGLIEDLSG